MTDFQAEKQIVRDYLAALDQLGTGADDSRVRASVSPDYLWRGFHPFDEIRGIDTVLADFWRPLHQSLRSLQRRLDIFMAGENSIEGHEGVWVASMGHLMGLFDAAWLGIQPTGKIAMLRYADFHRVENGVITETAMYFDIPHLTSRQKKA